MILIYSLIFIAVIFIIAGFVGCIIPVIPGPLLPYISLLMLQYSAPSPPFSNEFLLWMGVANIAVVIFDYIVPVLGVKMYGATKYGVWGSIIGMTVGIFFIPPIGMMIGVLLGAVIGELIAGKKCSKALKTGVVSFLSTVFVIILKMSLCAVTAFYYFKNLRALL